MNIKIQILPVQFYSLVFVFQVLAIAWISCSNAATAQNPIYFEDTVAPILRKNCIACHNVKLAEGKLNLETPADIKKGGDSGSSINATEVDKSLLITRPAGTEDEIMPPDGNTVGAERLKPEQLKAIKDWIAGGALSKGTTISKHAMRLPETARASYALAISPNNDFVAFGRGGQLVIHNARRLSTSQNIEGMLDATPSQVIPNAHPDFIHSIAISQDGQRIATGSTGEVKIWRHVSNPIESARIALETAGIPLTNLLATSNDGSLHAAVQKRAPAKIDPSIEKPANPLTPGIITILNQSGEIVNLFDVQDAALVAATWSPSNNHLFAAGLNQTLYAWDLKTSPIAEPSRTPMPIPVRSVISLDEATLLVISERKVIVLQYKGTTAETIPEHPLATAINGAGPVDMVNISNDRSTIVVATQDDSASVTSLKLWNVKQAKLLGIVEKDRTDQLAFVNGDRTVQRVKSAIERSKTAVGELEKAVTAESTALATAKTNKEKAAEALAKKEQERLAAVQAIADHEKVMAETKAAIDAATQKLTQLTTDLEPKKKTVVDLEKQKSDSQAAMENADKSIIATEETLKAAQARLEARKQQVAKETEDLTQVEATSATLKTKAESVKFSAQTVAFADNNTIAASVNRVVPETSRIELFSVDTLERIDSQLIQQPMKSIAALSAVIEYAHPQGEWQQERFIESPNIVLDRVTALAFSPDGNKLAIGSGLPSRSGQLAIVNVNDGKPIAMTSSTDSTTPSDSLDLHSDSVLGLSYSPDGKWLASCGADKMTKLIDTSSNKVVKIFEGHTHHVLSLAWHDGGHRLATASADGTVKIWDLERGESARTVTGYGTEVTSLSFIGNTDNVAASSMNNLVRIHESGSGKQVKQLSPAADSLYSVAVTPNGKYVMSVGQEGIVRTWKIEDGKLIGEWK